MDKSFLEQKIKERAEDRFKKEWGTFIESTYKTDIGKLIKIDVNVPVDKSDKVLPMVNHGCNWGILNNDMATNKNAKFCNYEEVKKALIEEYIKEETDILLNKIASMNEYFADNQNRD